MGTFPQRGNTRDAGDFAHLRRLMVERHLIPRGIADPRILAAMSEVPRHLFVPTAMAAKAYGPSALPIGQRQTISQPYVVARMLELLELEGGERILEIGTGTGYQAAVLARLVSQVFTVERIPDLAAGATANFKRLNIRNVNVKVFDGTYGWSDHAPYDRIIVAAAAPQVPEPLIAQLSRRGRMILPLGQAGAQRLARVSRVATTLQIEDCGTAEFVPLVGRFGYSG